MGKKLLYLSPRQVEKKFKDAGLGLKETLSLIEMTWDTPQGSVLKPPVDYLIPWMSWPVQRSGGAGSNDSGPTVPINLFKCLRSIPGKRRFWPI